MRPPRFVQRRRLPYFWEPREKRQPGDDMTIAAGFRFAQGVMLCADTQQTTPGVMKVNASKIVREDLTAKGGGQLVFALSGSVLMRPHGY